jgi:hypothetical protein
VTRKEEDDLPKGTRVTRKDRSDRIDSASRKLGLQPASGERLWLLPDHAALIRDSGITAQVAQARGYRSITTKTDLTGVGFAESQRRVPTLLIPVYNVHGDIATYQHRPDTPRIVDGKPLKYETPKGSRMTLDVPPPARAWLGDPTRPLFITEGSRKADAAVSRELCCIALLGVWTWRGTNEQGGKVALPDWESIALNERQVFIAFDSDVVLKRAVHQALARLKAFLEQRGASVAMIYLPPAEAGKVGLDDYLAAGHAVADLLALATTQLREPETHQDESPTIVAAGRLSDITNAAARVLAHGNTTEPRIFQQGGAIVRLRLDDDVTPHVTALGPDALRGELDRAATWLNAKGEPCFPRWL